MSEDTGTWRAVPDYEGLYEVSDQGLVRSLRRRTSNGMRGGKMLKLRVAGPGYHQVTLWADGKPETAYVHRLVLAAFIGPLPPGQETRHLDGNKLNNLLANLAYGTQSENGLDRVRHGTHNHAGKTHCISGHELTPENIYPNGRGRQCRPCAQRRAREQKQRQRET